MEIIKIMLHWRDSSVGRVRDFKSTGRGFESPSRLQVHPQKEDTNEKSVTLQRPTQILITICISTFLVINYLVNQMKRNIFVRVKLKSLAAEARIFRADELKCKKLGQGNSWQRQSLYDHRVGTVRREARATLLAYQYLRGIPYAACETPNPEKHNPLDVDSIRRMIKKYGPSNFTNKHLTDWFEGNALAKAA